jgi:hypothetical protein
LLIAGPGAGGPTGAVKGPGGLMVVILDGPSVFVVQDHRLMNSVHTRPINFANRRESDITMGRRPSASPVRSERPSPDSTCSNEERQMLTVHNGTIFCEPVAAK